MVSWLLIREDDFVAEKLEKMFFESLRGLGDAGDCGIWWRAALGAAKSPSPRRLGDRGLLGLIGMLTFSLPALPRMANDNVDDLGIFLSVLGFGVGSQVLQGVDSSTSASVSRKRVSICGEVLVVAAEGRCGVGRRCTGGFRRSGTWMAAEEGAR